MAKSIEGRGTFETVDNLRTRADADAAAYLEDADDPAVIARSLGAIARSGNLSELAGRPT